MVPSDFLTTTGAVTEPMRPLMLSRTKINSVKTKLAIGGSHGDLPEIERALVNLLDNALKFSPPDTPVRVRVESGDRVEVVLVRILGSAQVLDVRRAFVDSGELADG